MAVEFRIIPAPPTWLDPVLRGSDLSSVEHMGETWIFGIGAHCTISTESPWRVVSSNGVALARDDDAQLFGRPNPIDVLTVLAEILAGPVWSAAISPFTSDLRLDFRSVRLELLNLSSGYEAWRLHSEFNGENLELIAMGGGALSAPVGQRN